MTTSCRYTCSLNNALDPQKGTGAVNSERKALIFDRDNTLVRDNGYLHKVADLEWLPGVIETLRLGQESGYLLFVVSNQGGIGRGKFSLNSARKFNLELLKRLFAEGIAITEIRFCPHHPAGSVPKYSGECPQRKPNPGMINSLVYEWTLDRAQCALFGDDKTDIAAARSAGISGHRVNSGEIYGIVKDFIESASSVFNSKINDN